MANKMTVEDFANDGFEVYDEKPKAKKAMNTPSSAAAPSKFSKNTSKIIIMDNKEVLVAVKESNKTLQTGLEQLVYAMESKPDSFTLDIERDQHGFMKSIKVKVNR